MTPVRAKSTSHEFLRRHSIEVNETLPELETPEQLSPQDSQTVASRIIVLSYVVGVGYGTDVRRISSSIEKFGLSTYVSTEEWDLLRRSEHTEDEKMNASTWLPECVQSLAWCVGVVELDPFRRCDDDLADHLPPPFTDPRAFISAAALRPFEEIYLQADLHYRLHWAARNARLAGRRPRVSEGATSARRKALDWVIGVESNWDEIPLDT